MDEYIGLDVSLEETAISIRRDGQRIWRGKCKSDPNVISTLVRKRAPGAKRMVFETGPLSVWFYHALSAGGLPTICIDARHAKAVLNMAANKTDANDADGLAQLAEAGFYREVRVKGYDSMQTRTLVAARTKMIRICTELSNQIRRLMPPHKRAIRQIQSTIRGRRPQFERETDAARNACAEPLPVASMVIPTPFPCRDSRHVRRRRRVSDSPCSPAPSLHTTFPD